MPNLLDDNDVGAIINDMRPIAQAQNIPQTKRGWEKESEHQQQGVQQQGAARVTAGGIGKAGRKRKSIHGTLCVAHIVTTLRH